MGYEVTETQGRSYVTKAYLRIKVKNDTGNPVVIPGVLPIYRTGMSELLGFGSVSTYLEDALEVKVFIDFASPERLELENGVPMYLDLIVGNPIHFVLTDQKPEGEDILPVGAPALAFL